MTAAESVNEEAVEAARYVLDRDGDLWMTVGPSLWKCLTTDSCLVAGADLVNVCGPLVELRSERRIRESIAGEEVERVEYGHVMPPGDGWMFEPRGIKYATHQRTVRYRLGEPVAIDHWTYTDHRHPVEGCTHDRHDLTTRPSS